MTTVVVTGIGATSPLGGDVASTWKALLAGESGVSTLDYDWVQTYDLPVTFAGQAKVRPETVLDRQEFKRLDPSAQLALISAREAWADAGAPDVAPERIGAEPVRRGGRLQRVTGVARQRVVRGDPGPEQGHQHEAGEQHERQQRHGVLGGHVLHVAERRGVDHLHPSIPTRGSITP